MIFTNLSLTLLDVAGIIGALAFALSGYLLGLRKNLDIMGLFILAFLAANGGGMLRDILLGRLPDILISTRPFWLALGVVAAAFLFRLRPAVAPEKRWGFIVSDAIGLVAFAITGSLTALAEGMHIFGGLTLAFLTATGGGIIRDLLVNDVPEVLHGGFYGSVALLVGLSLYGLDAAGLVTPLSVILVFTAALALRIVAWRRGWQLPKAALYQD